MDVQFRGMEVPTSKGKEETFSGFGADDFDAQLPSLPAADGMEQLPDEYLDVNGSTTPTVHAVEHKYMNDAAGEYLSVGGSTTLAVHAVEHKYMNDAASSTFTFGDDDTSGDDDDVDI